MILNNLAYILRWEKIEIKRTDTARYCGYATWEPQFFDPLQVQPKLTFILKALK